VQGQTFTTIFSFNGIDGKSPYAGLIQGTDGNLYGTTAAGGANYFGSVFKITPDGAFTTLYNFCSQPGCLDGELPQAGLIQAYNGDLYGTTNSGGASGAGTIFKITRGGALTTLYSFNGTDAGYPTAGLVQAAHGDLYGTTTQGGPYLYDGTIFQITPSGAFTLLHTFSGTDGNYPSAALVRGADGDLYGTTQEGGASTGTGTIFKITPNGTLTTLHIFNGTDGEDPGAPLIQAGDGNFYGVTQFDTGAGHGTIFKITPGGVFTALHTLDGKDGGVSTAALVQGTDGDLYGTTQTYGALGYGTIFKITLNGVFTTVHTFSGGAGGALPVAGLIQDTNGDFYGTTVEGGDNGVPGSGAIFRFSEGVRPFVEIQPALGKAGEIVRIVGTDLAGATAVTFDGTSAIFAAISGHEILAQVPAGASSGNIQVVTAAGTILSKVPFRML
jgi:uncharacterized repeat protein (TIGR03803 family)